MRSPPKALAALLFCAAIGVGGWWLWSTERLSPIGPHSQPVAPAPVDVVTPRPGSTAASGATLTGNAPAPALAGRPVASAPEPFGPPPSPRIVLRPTAVQPEPGSGLAPRMPLAKEPLVLPPGRVHRLTVKLSDGLLARAGASGELLVTAETVDAVAGLARVAEEWDLRFLPTQTTSEEKLQRLQQRAAERTGRAQPDLGGMLEAALPQATPERVLAAAIALQSLPEVEFATIQSVDAPPPPPADIAPPTPSLVSHQTYRLAATGVDVNHVWTTYGIKGAPGLRVTDCEYMFRPTHEDLAGRVSTQTINQSMYTAFGDDHGTAAVGVLAAGDNGYGMVGSAPVCSAWFYPEFSTVTGGGFQSRSATVVAAIADSSAGDIVMLEMQDTGADGQFGPAEYNQAVWTAVKVGTDAGVIVVAAAGNGPENMDSPAWAAYRNRGDSGAIIVGAGSTTRERLSFSTFGARVNLQGWGQSVATTGYGSLATYGGDPDQEYTATFSGTSSATPVVTSAVCLLQAVAIEILGRRLTPAEVRSLLVSTGRAQTGDTTKPIGPLPNLAAAVTQLFVLNPPTLSTIRSWGFYEFATPTPNLTADSDGNGLPNVLEYVLGSDPNDQAPGDAALLPRVSVQPGPGADRTVRYEFNNPPGRTAALWAVESSPTMVPGSWQTLAHGVGGVTISRSGNTVWVEIVESASADRRFLRLRATVP